MPNKERHLSSEKRSIKLNRKVYRLKVFFFPVQLLVSQVLNIYKHFLAFAIFIVGLELGFFDEIQNVNKKHDLSFVVCLHNKEF